MKVKIKEKVLEIRSARDFQGRGLTIIKLSYEQALAFSSVRSFSELAEKYGEENILKEGEEYHGYVVVFIAPSLQEIVHMDGRYIFSLDPQRGPWRFLERKGCQTKKWLGVWTFNLCLFKEMSEMLKKRGLLVLRRDTADVSKTLKRKLTSALIRRGEADLDEDEYNVLKGYFIPSDYEKIFEEHS